MDAHFRGFLALRIDAEADPSHIIDISRRLGAAGDFLEPIGRRVSIGDIVDGARVEIEFAIVNFEMPPTTLPAAISSGLMNLLGSGETDSMMRLSASARIAPTGKPCPKMVSFEFKHR